MDNQQAIHWFSGFFEGEGCFTIVKRAKKGKNIGFNLEPRISISTTNKTAFEICRSVLNQLFIPNSFELARRKGRLPCYSIYIARTESIRDFTIRLLPYLECDRERCIIFNKFCQSRLARLRYSDINNYEWELYKELQQWSASTTTREESYSEDDNWLAGVYEAEGTFSISQLGVYKIQLCNTNNHIIWKAYQNLLSIGLSGHLKRYETGNPNHQPYWLLSLHGKNKCLKFADYYQSYFRCRREELDKIKIWSSR